MQFFLPPLLIAVTFLISGSGCYANSDIDSKLRPALESTIAIEPSNTGAPSTEKIDNGANASIKESTETVFPLFTEVKEGLHVTGTPIEIDIKEYRLDINGLVKNELSLSFDEIKSLPSERVYVVLECPGFFVDKGYWTGVKIIDILNIAEIDKKATKLRFVDIDDSYDSSILIEKIKKNEKGFLVSYEFNDQGFSEIHGFPLRVVAEGEPGNVWVKWLGTIEVLE